MLVAWGVVGVAEPRESTGGGSERDVVAGAEVLGVAVSTGSDESSPVRGGVGFESDELRAGGLGLGEAYVVVRPSHGVGPRSYDESLLDCVLDVLGEADSLGVVEFVNSDVEVAVFSLGGGLWGDFGGLLFDEVGPSMARGVGLPGGRPGGPLLPCPLGVRVGPGTERHHVRCKNFFFFFLQPSFSFIPRRRRG